LPAAAAQDDQGGQADREHHIQDRDPGLRVLGVCDAAASPSTKAATTPIPSVAPSAPR
jgi:hypothetical protein